MTKGLLCTVKNPASAHHSVSVQVKSSNSLRMPFPFEMVSLPGRHERRCFCLSCPDLAANLGHEEVPAQQHAVVN